MICTVIPTSLPHFSYTGFHIVGVVEQHVGIVEQQKHGDKVGMAASNSSVYCTAQKFRGSKFSRIAVFENLVEIISRIHCPKHATPTLFMGVTCWNSIARTLELSFIDLAAAVNTRNQEGMRALLEDPATKIAENCYARVKNFVEIISRMTLHSRNSRKFWPAKFLRYTVCLRIV